MSDLASATVARLSGTAPFRHVAGATEFLRLVKPPVDKMPALFVLPFKESYSPRTPINRVRQAGVEQIAIVMMVAVKPGAGADVHNPIAAPREALIRRLLGWQPDAEDGAVLLVSGELLDAEPTHLSYQYVFRRDHDEREPE